MGMFDFLFSKKSPAHPEQPKRIFDWRTSEPHLLLLSRYLYAQEAKDAVPPHWETVLGAAPQIAVEHFIADGLLVPASLSAKLDRTFKATELKPFLKERGLPVSGKKDALIERLVAADPVGMARQVEHLNIVECAPDARAIAEKYVAEKRAEKEAASTESLSLLKAREFRKASLAVARYEAKQVFPRGIGIDWSRYDPTNDERQLEMMFSARPKILAGLPDDEWDQLRSAAAMMSLWGTNTAREWLPESFVGIPRFDANTAARMIMFHSNHKRDMERFREMGIKKALIRGCGESSCEACRKIADKPMLLAKIPELPHGSCTHEMGCRCYAEPA